MIKNQKEINNIKKAHVQDGVALTRYLFWLKKNLGKKTITEISASQKLLSFRKKIEILKLLVSQQFLELDLMELSYIIKQRRNQTEL